MEHELAKGGCLHYTCGKCKSQFCGSCKSIFKNGVIAWFLMLSIIYNDIYLLIFKAECKFNVSCAQFGFHAHHPYNCYYHIRDYSIEKISEVLLVCFFLLLIYYKCNVF